MRESSGKVVVFSLAAALFFGASCAGGGGEEAPPAAAPAEDTPEAAAVEYRHSLMHMMSWKNGQLRQMAQGEVPPDDAVFTKHAGDIAALASMITDGFIPGSDITGSRALPDIWQNWDDFTQKAGDLQAAAAALAASAEEGGFAAGQSAALDLGQSCGACHNNYRAPNQ